MVPIVSKCGTCGTPSAIGKANSELHHFKQFPGMSYFEFKCPKCNEEELIFFMQDGRWTIGQALNMGLITHEGLEPTEDDIAYFEVACGVKFGAVTYNLGPTLTKEVDRFAEVLANTPDDVLLDLFSSPPAKSSLPKRWADK